MTPQQDLVIGGFYLTELRDGVKGEGRVFRQLYEIVRALDNQDIDLHAKIQVPSKSSITDEKYLSANKKYVTTTPGRLLFEERLPAGFVKKFGHINDTLRKREFGVIVERLSDHFTKSEIALALDGIKDLCYRYATQSGLTVSVDDVKTPKAKRAILDDYEKQAEKVEQQFRRGIITDGERRQQEVRIWTDATADVQKAMETEFKALKYLVVLLSLIQKLVAKQVLQMETFVHKLHSLIQFLHIQCHRQ